MNITVEQIARICHEANRAWCLALGDDTQVPWEDAPDWQRRSVREGVRNILRNPETKAYQSHEPLDGGEATRGVDVGSGEGR